MLMHWDSPSFWLLLELSHDVKKALHELALDTRET